MRAQPRRKWKPGDAWSVPMPPPGAPRNVEGHLTQTAAAYVHVAPALGLSRLLAPLDLQQHQQRQAMYAGMRTQLQKLRPTEVK